MLENSSQSFLSLGDRLHYRMGGGNAQKSAMARARNMEKAQAAKVSESME